MTSEQNAIEWAKDQIQRGLLTADEANVKIVQMVGVKVVSNKLPASVRKALMAAVKAKELGRLPKKALAPEVFYHINGRANALQVQQRIERDNLNRLNGVFA